MKNLWKSEKGWKKNEEIGNKGIKKKAKSCVQKSEAMVDPCCMCFQMCGHIVYNLNLFRRYLSFLKREEALLIGKPKTVP